MNWGIQGHGSVANNHGNRSRHSFYHVHWYIYPLVYWLELLTDFLCLEKSAFDMAQSDEAAQWIKDHAADRETFKIDPTTDPLFINANEAITNPEKTLNENIIESPEEEISPDEFKTCEESGDEYPQSCSRKLEIQLKVTPEKGHYKNATCKGHWKNKRLGTKKYCEGRCKNSKYVIDQPRQVEVIREE